MIVEFSKSIMTLRLLSSLNLSVKFKIEFFRCVLFKLLTTSKYLSIFPVHTVYNKKSRHVFGFPITILFLFQSLNSEECAELGKEAYQFTPLAEGSFGTIPRRAQGRSKSNFMGSDAGSWKNNGGLAVVHTPT